MGPSDRGWLPTICEPFVVSGKVSIQYCSNASEKVSPLPWKFVTHIKIFIFRSTTDDVYDLLCMYIALYTLYSGICRVWTCMEGLGEPA